VNVLATGGGAFPYPVDITVGGTTQRGVTSTFDFLVPDLTTYPVSTSYANHRPFATSVSITSYGQLVVVPALLDDLSEMTVDVKTKWGSKPVTAASVTVVGPKTDTVQAALGSGYFTNAQGHALYGTNQAGDTPYTATASATGFDSGSVSGVSLVPGQTLSPNRVIYLVTTHMGTFNITTRYNSNGTLRPNSVIRITGPSSQPGGEPNISSSTYMDFTSDGSGKIYIDYLPLGKYTLQYMNGSTPNSVKSGSPQTLTNDGQTLTFDVKW